MDFNRIHDKLTRAYYEEGRLTKEQFLKLHLACHLLQEKEQIDLGAFEDYRNRPEHDPNNESRREFIIRVVQEAGISLDDLRAWDR